MASLLVAAVGALAVSAGTKALIGKPKAAQTRMQPVPTRNAAADALRGSDEFSRRRGFAANIMTGTRGAEASLGGAKSALGR